MTVTCQCCGARVKQTVATQFHSGWCIDCIHELIDHEEEAIKHLVSIANKECLITLLPEEHKK